MNRLRTWQSLPITRIALLLTAIVLVGQGCGSSADGGVLYSEDVGETWEYRVYVGQDRRRVLTIADQQITDIEIDPFDSNILYIGTDGGGIFKTNTRGEQWWQLPTNAANINDIEINPQEANELFVAVGAYIIRSQDSGETWDAIYQDTQEDAFITRVVVDWFNADRVYATTSLGQVVQSVDGGENWREVHKVNKGIANIAMSPADSRILYISEFDRSVHRTEDAGENWTDLFDNEAYQDEFLAEYGNAEKVKRVTIDVNNPDTIYISTDEGIVRSNDRGNSFELMETLFIEGRDENEFIRDVVSVPGRPGTLVYTVSNVIYKTTDYGSTWRVIEDFPSSRRITDIEPDPDNSEALFAGTRQVGGGGIPFLPTP